MIKLNWNGEKVFINIKLNIDFNNLTFIIFANLLETGIFLPTYFLHQNKN